MTSQLTLFSLFPHVVVPSSPHLPTLPESEPLPDVVVGMDGGRVDGCEDGTLDPESIVDASSISGAALADMIKMGLERVSRELELENARLQAMIQATETPPPPINLTNVEGKINATGLTLKDWLRITQMVDSPKARGMWAADYDAIEVMFINRGSLPGHHLLNPSPPLPVHSPPFPPNTIGAILVGGSPVLDTRTLTIVLADQSPPTPRRSSSRARSRPVNPAEPGESMAMRRISERQQELLGQLVVVDERAVFTSEDRIDDWDALKAVMGLLGAKWKMGRRGGGKGGFTFPDGVDVAETIRLARIHGEVFDPKKAGFYATSDDVADDLVRRVPLAELEIQLGRPLHVIEPSAGTGSLMRAILRTSPTTRVSCVELLQSHRDELSKLDCSVIGTDFLSLSPTSLDPFDAAIMNPPFGSGGDAKHVMHAIKFVRPMGYLAAIISPGIEHRSTELFTMLRRWIERHGGGKVAIPAGAFAQAGTNVRTYMIWGRVCEGCKTGECVGRE